MFLITFIYKPFGTLSTMNKPRIVCIGGGTGQAAILEGLKEYDCGLTGIVGVTDNGGYSGKIREAMGIPQPGDSRSVLASVADESLTITKLMKYRFTEGELSGTSLGNLMLAALTRLEGDFSKAVEKMSRLVNAKAMVLPVTNKSTQICAELLNGEKLEGEWDIIKKSKSNIKKLFLKDKAEPAKGVIEALRSADMIVVSPGSLRTGIIPILLVDGVAKAAKESKAKKIYVCNIMTHPGQTDNFTASMHTDEIKKYCNCKFDYILVNSGKPSDKLLEAYRKEGAVLVAIDNIRDKATVIVDDFAAMMDHTQLMQVKRAYGKEVFGFPHYIRHDSKKVAKIIIELIK